MEIERRRIALWLGYKPVATQSTTRVISLLRLSFRVHFPGKRRSADRFNDVSLKSVRLLMAVVAFSHGVSPKKTPTVVT